MYIYRISNYTEFYFKRHSRQCVVIGRFVCGNDLVSNNGDGLLLWSLSRMCCIFGQCVHFQLTESNRRCQRRQRLGRRGKYVLCVLKLNGFTYNKYIFIYKIIVTVHVVSTLAVEGEALDIRTLHDCPSQMNENLLITVNLVTLINKFEFICAGQSCWVCII